MALIPDFIEASKQMEDQLLEQHEVNEAQGLIENKQVNDQILAEVHGKYHLDECYDLSDFLRVQYANGSIVNGKHADYCRVFMCQE